MSHIPRTNRCIILYHEWARNILGQFAAIEICVNACYLPSRRKKTQTKSGKLGSKNNNSLSRVFTLMTLVGRRSMASRRVSNQALATTGSLASKRTLLGLKLLYKIVLFSDAVHLYNQVFPHSFLHNHHNSLPFWFSQARFRILL